MTRLSREVRANANWRNRYCNLAEIVNYPNLAPLADTCGCGGCAECYAARNVS